MGHWPTLFFASNKLIDQEWLYMGDVFLKGKISYKVA